MDPSLIKALLINAAYEGAVAVCEALTDADGAKVAIDPLIQDVALRKKGVLVYEEAKVQYAALLRAFEDKSGIWPDPKVPAASTPPATVPPTKTLGGTVGDLLGGAVDQLTKK